MEGNPQMSNTLYGNSCNKMEIPVKRRKFLSSKEVPVSVRQFLSQEGSSCQRKEIPVRVQKFLFSEAWVAENYL